MWIHFINSGRTSDNGFSVRNRAVVMPVLSDTITDIPYIFVSKTNVIVIPFFEMFLLVFTRLEKVG